LFLNHFEYFAPQAAKDALDLCDRLGAKAKILAGGTDLLNLMKDKLLKPEYLIDINNVDEFKGIFYEPGKGAVIGAATKISEIERSEIIREKYFALHQAAGELGSVQVRNMATIGGNICNASPAAETPTPLVALGAKVVISSLSGDREMPLEEFILGNGETALAEGEILTKFLLPEPISGSVSRYGYIGLRDAMEIDAVNLAVNLALGEDGRIIKQLKLVMGSVFPRPLVSEEAPEILIGKEFSAELAEEAARAASSESKPISDIRASAEYRREIVAVLSRRLLQEAFSAAQGEV